MIVIAIGANLSGPSGSALQNCEAAISALDAAGIIVRRRSRWYRSPPWVPPEPARRGAMSQHDEPQPWYVNGVVLVETAREPAELLASLHDIEARFGRVRMPERVNAPRPLDLDLIDYNGLVRDGDPPILPHPRVESRAFVLRPLAEIAPNWRNPKSGRSVKDLLDALPPDAVAEPLTALPRSS